MYPVGLLDAFLPQKLKPKSLDVRQEELGAMVDKEMAATSAAIEDAVRRIEVRTVLGTLQFLKEPWGLGKLSAGCTHLGTRPPCKADKASPPWFSNCP